MLPDSNYRRLRDSHKASVITAKHIHVNTQMRKQASIISLYYKHVNSKRICDT